MTSLGARGSAQTDITVPDLKQTIDLPVLKTYTLILMTASYTNTDRVNKSRRALKFPVMIPSTCSTTYSLLKNLLSSRLISEHQSSTCYSSVQNLSSSRLISEHQSSTWYSSVQNLSSSRLIPEHYTTIINSSITDAESSYKLTASLNCGYLRTGGFWET